MRGPRSLSSALPALLLAASACTSSSTAVETLLYTDIHVSPSSFLGARACGRTAGAAQSYSVTFYEVPDDAPEPTGDIDCGWSFVTPAIKPVGTSPPVPCGLEAAFGDVVPGARYIAAIDVFELPPCGSVADAACVKQEDGRIIRADTGEDVLALPEDRTCCGYPTPRPVSGPDPHATIAGYLVRRRMIDCHPLEAATGTPTVRVRTADIQGLVCGTADGAAATVTLSGVGPSKEVACGAEASLPAAIGLAEISATARTAAGSVVGRASCSAKVTTSGIEFVAACDPLTTRGSVSVFGAKVCNGAATFDVTLVGVGTKSGVACTGVAVFDDLEAGSYTAVVTTAAGKVVCTADVGVGEAVTASCP